MVRTAPALLALLLLLSAPGVFAFSDAQGAHPSSDSAARAAVAQPALDRNNTTRVYLLEDVRAQNFTRPTADVATTLDVQQSALERRFTRYRFEERVGKLEGSSAKEQLLLNVTSQVDSEIAAMQRREARARAAYNRGDSSARAYVQELAYLDAKATDLESVLDGVSDYTARGSLAEKRVQHLRSRLAAFEGPVRKKAGNAVLGRTDPFTLFVSSSPNGVALSALSDQQANSVYVREWYRADHVDAAVNDSRRPSTAAMTNEIAPRFYPNLETLQIGSSGASLKGRDSYFYYGTYPGGRLELWYDVSAQSVYRATQWRYLNLLPPGPAEQTFEGEYVLTVDRTYAGGPLRVTLTNRTGTPLAGEVRIDGETVGDTGPDGALWTLGPPGTFNVTVVHQGTRITTSARAVRAEG